MKKSNRLLIFAAAFAVIIAALVSIVIMTPRGNISAPKSVSAQSSASGIEISWSRVRGASHYEIYKRVSGKDELQFSTKDRSYADPNVRDGKTYIYGVRAVSNLAQGDLAQVKCVYLVEPKISDTQNTTNGIKITWTKTKKAKKISIFRKEISETSKNDEWTQLDSVSASKNSYLDKNVKNEKTYIYCVRQERGSYSSTFGNYTQEVRFTEAVRNLLAKNSPQGIRLGWKAFDGASDYIISRKTAGEDAWQEIGKSGGKTAYTDKTAAFGKQNSYKVCAVLNGESKSAFSSAASLYAVDPTKKMIALTFDDGPYRPATTKILDAAEKYGARVTFFVVGSRVDSYSDCVKRAAKLGCEVGSHTYNHTILTTASKETIDSEISNGVGVIEKYTGKKVKVIRCPGGAVNEKVSKYVKYPLINWSVDTLDWKTRNTQSTVENIKNHAADGSIVLMHDLYDSSANAAQEIIPWLQKNGYQLVTVPEMMDAKGKTPENGKLYYNF